ncbi:hypothetical protein [Kutzneria chonburiensis]|uniref:Thioredoxin n=1 Tax=Kutzneria chonburiensis TaxID=1483604 RepID=A0ABV6N4W6_9PSEU|nr:hypothetical protein [Kutzneria chonburiensis]
MFGEPGGKWLTLFVRNDEEGRELLRMVLTWCRWNLVSCLYREPDQGTREEYNVTDAPTLRYFDLDSGASRVEVVGADEIRAWIRQSENQ